MLILAVEFPYFGGTGPEFFVAGRPWIIFSNNIQFFWFFYFKASYYYSVNLFYLWNIYWISGSRTVSFLHSDTNPI